MGTWTPERIVGLAPGAAAAGAGRELASPRKWKSLGKSGGVVWGEIQGSVAKPYQTQLEVNEPAFKCSCPSRKVPCKHALGLFLLWAGHPDALPTAETPAWVGEWSKTRQARVEPAPNGNGAGVADVAVASKRAADRERKVAAGGEELRRWLGDVMRHGLAALPGKPYSFYEAPGARMVDAQAPGLARLVRALATIPSGGEGWQSRMLDRLARLHLLLESYTRLQTLPPETQADVRSLIGWTERQVDVSARPGLRDVWMVVGRKIETEDRLHVVSTWLWGKHSGRGALILDFAHMSEPLELAMAVGTEFDGELAFYSGSVRVRGVVKQRFGEVAAVTSALAGAPVDEAMNRFGEALAKNPWLDRWPMVVGGVTPVRDERGWVLRDDAGRSLSLSARTFGWDLLAISGGSPVTVFGEFDGDRLHVYGVFSEGKYLPNRGAHESVE